jgi:diadenosine tetraphosphate (Ap4A) HIT family hydrolase
MVSISTYGWTTFPLTKGTSTLLAIGTFRIFSHSPMKSGPNCQKFWHAAKPNLDQEYMPAGYNIGINDGQAAGQTVMHLHIHVIPRYQGDVPNPRGGIRNFKTALREY